MPRVKEPMDCAMCGLTNRPHAEACAACGRPLQERAAAAAVRREWDALSPELRARYEREFDEQLAAWHAYRAWLRRNRKLYAVAGALLFAVLTASSLESSLFLFYAVVGAACTLFLDHLRGGPIHGMGLFALGWAACAVGHGLWGGSLAGMALISRALPFAGVVVAGHLLGLRLEDEHCGHAVRP